MSEAGAGRGGWDCHVHVFDASLPVPAGHYRPAHRPLAQIEAAAAVLGVRHLVLVQPSVYGHDNTLLLKALAAAAGRHRGVVVLGEDDGDDTLDGLHAAGVRGVRLNLVSPLGEPGDAAARFAALAPRLRVHGWHLQWYAQPAQLPLVARLHAGSGVTCVLDHLAGLRADAPAVPGAWPALQALADQGAWLKLSGWYRLGATEPYEALLPQLQRLAALFRERIVWGSDWPHTAFEPQAMPRYASTWQPVSRALGADAAHALLHRVPSIYR